MAPQNGPNNVELLHFAGNNVCIQRLACRAIPPSADVARSHVLPQSFSVARKAAAMPLLRMKRLQIAAGVCRGISYRGCWCACRVVADAVRSGGDGRRNDERSDDDDRLTRVKVEHLTRHGE